MAAISVKVPTAKMIESLEKKLTLMRLANVKFGMEEREHEVKVSAWQDELLALTRNLTPKVEYQRWNDRITLEFKMSGVLVPPEPKRTANTDLFTDKIIEQVENAIRILKMTDEITVNTSTFKEVSKYL